MIKSVALEAITAASLAVFAAINGIPLTVLAVFIAAIWTLVADKPWKNTND